MFLFFFLHWEVDQCQLDHLSSGLAAAVSLALLTFSKSLCCRKMQLLSDARHALPLAMAIRSDTLLTGTPLRVTLTWMKSVAGDRLEPSAFNKWTCRYPEKEDYTHYTTACHNDECKICAGRRSIWAPVRRLVKGRVNCPTKSFLAVWSWSSTTNRTRARSGTCSWKLRVQSHRGLKPVEGAREP